MKNLRKIVAMFLVMVIAVGVIPTSTAYAADTKTRVETTDLRYWGSNRYGTSYSCLQKMYNLNSKKKLDNVIIACGTNYPDALGGGYLATTLNAPIVLVSTETEKTALAKIEKYVKKGANAYILGGTLVVRSQFEKSLKTAGFSVKRYSGVNRFGTNLAILKKTKKSDELIVVNGMDYADALTVSSTKKPVLMVNKSLTKDQKSFLKSQSYKNIYIVGGTRAIPTSVEKDLKSYASEKVKRIYGKSKWETTVKAAEEFFPNAKSIALAYGKNWPDALSGSAIAGAYNAPMVLVANDNWKYAHNFVVDKKIKRSISFGGQLVVPDKTVSNIMEQYIYHNHTWDTKWTVDKTYHWHKCTSNDGGVKDKAKHTYGAWVQNIQAGTETRTCTVCKIAKETRTAAHNYSVKWTNTSDYKQATATFTCSHCGNVHKETVTLTETTKPECGQNGKYKSKTITFNGKSYSKEFTKTMPDHKWVSEGEWKYTVEYVYDYNATMEKAKQWVNELKAQGYTKYNTQPLDYANLIVYKKIAIKERRDPIIYKCTNSGCNKHSYINSAGERVIY